MFIGFVEPAFRVMEASNNVGVILFAMVLIPCLYLFRGMAVAAFVYITMHCLKDLLRSKRHPIVSCLILSVNFVIIFLVQDAVRWFLIDLGAFYMIFKIIYSVKTRPYEPANKYAIRK